MECRPGCGACCIAPSISSPIPGMPAGKKAGERCVWLSPVGLCGLYGDARRPAVCSSFQAHSDTCGTSREEALVLIERMERLTASSRSEF